MPRPSTRSPKSRPLFKVGDRAVVHVGSIADPHVEIVEDRGVIGYPLQQHYRVRTTDPDVAEPVYYEVPEDFLIPPAVVKSTARRNGLAVGDHVLVRIGIGSTLAAEIIEDRGLIGRGRRQYYRVRTLDTPDLAEPMDFEASADTLTRWHNPAPTRA